MRLVSSKTLLTLAAALVAVPGAAIAAAEPGEPLLRVAASDADETDCEALLEDEEADELDSDETADSDETTADADDTAEDGGAVEAQDVPEECEDQDEEVADDDAEDGSAEDESAEDDGTEDDPVVDEDEDVAADQDAVEADDMEESQEADDDAHGEIVSAVAACAPRGQERVEGFDLPNHGAYVSAAAKGETLEVGEGYDLGTLEGATALCDDLDTARADAQAPEDAGDDGTDGTAEVETSELEESAPERDAPAGPATEQRGGESGPPEHAGNAGGGKGKGPQDAPGRNR